jgi:DNA-binding transcriptional ArsR family regulator
MAAIITLHHSSFWVNVRAMVDLDDTLIALADETRRRILQRLSGGEARVTEVAAPFDISLNSVSKHIRILERAGLVRRHVSGRDHYLSLDPKPLNELTEWLVKSRDFWTAGVDALEAALRADDAIAAAKRSSPPTARRRTPK